MVVVVGLKRPEHEDDRRSRWSSLGGAVLVRSTRAGASHGLTDHLPARRGCSIGFDWNERVRPAILAFTVAP